MYFAMKRSDTVLSLLQDVPVSAGQVENYVLLLVLLSIFAGGTLVLLSLLLLFCHRCCMGGRRYSRWVSSAAAAGRTRLLGLGLVHLQNEDYRQPACQAEQWIIAEPRRDEAFWPVCKTGFSPLRASDDLEKTNTTYAEDSQPTQGQTLVLWI